MTQVFDPVQPGGFLALGQFRDWIQDARTRTQCYTTTNGVRTRSHEFISKTQIKKFLTSTRIRHLLNELFPREVPVRQGAVEERCLVGFCILLSIQRGRYVRELLKHRSLWDINLPFEGESSPHLPQDVWEQCIKAQWLFKPADLLPGCTKYPKDMRFPYLEKELIGEGTSARLYKVTVDSDYDNELRGSQHASDMPAPALSQVYALKEYKSMEDYKTETSNFETLCSAEVGSKSPPGLIGYFGAYEQVDSFNVLLEYGEGGSLYHYLRDKDPPTTGEAIYDFWSRILELLMALARIHNLEDANFDPGMHTGQRYQGTHHDIRPNNIVLVRDQNCFDGAEPHYTFRLADLGHGQFVKRGQAIREIDVLDPHGGRTYASPESYRADEFTGRSRLRVTPKTDIFSLGCVLLTVAVWIVHGPKGLEKFHEERMEENKRGDKDADYRFHDGHHAKPKLLAAVLARFETLPENMRRSDCTTGQVLNRLISPMLRPRPEGRPHAEFQRAEMEEVLQIAQKDLTMDRHRFSLASSGPVDGTLPESPSQVKSGRPVSVLSGGSMRSSLNPILHGRLLVTSPKQTMIDTSVSSSSAIPGDYPDSARSPLLETDTWLSKTVHRHGDPDGLNPRTHSSHNAEMDFHVGNNDQSLPHHLKDDPRGPVEHGKRPISTSTQPPTNETRLNDSPLALPTDLPELQSSPSNQHILSVAEPVSPSRSRHRSRPAMPYVTISEVLNWKRRRKRHMGMNKLFMRESDLPNKEYCERWLKQRDHIFLVDDSNSMRGHWRHVKDTFEVLFYLVKELDLDGIDVRFTCSNEYHHGKTTTDVLGKLETHKISNSGANIQHRLSDILRPTREALENIQIRSSRPPRPISIYVLSDGVWSSNQDAKTPILEIIESLERSRLQRTAIGISFVSFGNNQEALQRLRQLDDLGKTAGKKLDIVDTEPFDGNVWKMLVGPIDDYFDGDELVNPGTMP